MNSEESPAQPNTGLTQPVPPEPPSPPDYVPEVNISKRTRTEGAVVPTRATWNSQRPSPTRHGASGIERRG